MALAPSEFYRLLYSELRLIVEGYRARQKRQALERREESAWVVSWLLLPHKAADADPLTPDVLLGRKPHSKRAPEFSSPEAKARALITAFRAKSEQDGATDGK